MRCFFDREPVSAEILLPGNSGNQAKTMTSFTLLTGITPTVCVSKCFNSVSSGCSMLFQVFASKEHQPPTPFLNSLRHAPQNRAPRCILCSNAIALCHVAAVEKRKSKRVRCCAKFVYYLNQDVASNNFNFHSAQFAFVHPYTRQLRNCEHYFGDRVPLFSFPCSPSWKRQLSSL